MPVHFAIRSREDDPMVVACEECHGVATVVRKGELPHCARCGQPLCDDCKERIRTRGPGTTVAPARSEEESNAAPSKEQEFARGVLKKAGLSEEYAAIVAERISRPGADLSKSDQEYLALVKKQHATIGPWIKTPWSKTSN